MPLLEYISCDFLGFAVYMAASYVGKCLTKAAEDDMFVDKINDCEVPLWWKLAYHFGILGDLISIFANKFARLNWNRTQGNGFVRKTCYLDEA